jgi:hypothetical protein
VFAGRNFDLFFPSGNINPAGLKSIEWQAASAEMVFQAEGKSLFCSLEFPNPSLIGGW